MCANVRSDPAKGSVASGVSAQVSEPTGVTWNRSEAALSILVCVHVGIRNCAVAHRNSSLASLSPGHKIPPCLPWEGAFWKPVLPALLHIRAQHALGLLFPNGVPRPRPPGGEYSVLCIACVCPCSQLPLLAFGAIIMQTELLWCDLIPIYCVN